jgi:HEAT repeat protein
LAALGALSAAAGYFSLKTILELQKFADSTKATLETMQEEDKTLKKQLSEAYAATTKAQHHFYHLQEVKNPNPVVRIRAIQQLGQNNDIATVSLLTNIAQTETENNVKLEAIHWLGRTLRSTTEGATFGEGISALVSATEHNDAQVRNSAIEALDHLIGSNMTIPQYIIQRIRVVAQSDSDATTKKSAQDALEHYRQQSEKEASKPI